MKIGKNSRIYPHAYIGDHVTIGDNCTIYPHATIYNGCVIGNNCILHAGSVIGSDGFGFAPEGDNYKKIPQLGNVVLEDDVEIGANTTIDRAVMDSTIIAGVSNWTIWYRLPTTWKSAKTRSWQPR